MSKLDGINEHRFALFVLGTELLLNIAQAMVNFF